MAYISIEGESGLESPPQKKLRKPLLRNLAFSLAGSLALVAGALAAETALVENRIACAAAAGVVAPLGESDYLLIAGASFGQKDATFHAYGDGKVLTRIGIEIAIPNSDGGRKLTVNKTLTHLQEMGVSTDSSQATAGMLGRRYERALITNDYKPWGAEGRTGWHIRCRTAADKK